MDGLTCVVLWNVNATIYGTDCVSADMFLVYSHGTTCLESCFWSVSMVQIVSLWLCFWCVSMALIVSLQTCIGAFAWFYVSGEQIEERCSKGWLLGSNGKSISNNKYFNGK